MVGIHNTLEQDLHSLKVVWHNELARLLHVQGVIEPA